MAPVLQNNGIAYKAVAVGVMSGISERGVNTFTNL